MVGAGGDSRTAEQEIVVVSDDLRWGHSSKGTADNAEKQGVINKIALSYRHSKQSSYYQASVVYVKKLFHFEQPRFVSG